jgi:hypothetical protein
LDSDTKLANHLITISFTPKGQPMVVVRGNTAAEVTSLLASLGDQGVYMHLAGAQQALLGSVPPAEAIMRDLGGQPMGQVQHQQYPPQAAPPMASGYPAAPAAGGWNAGPPQPSPGQPPFGAPPGGYTPPQPAWGGGANQPPARPAGWYVVKIPFNHKEIGEQVRGNLKAQGLGSEMRWEGATKSWLVSPNVAQAFAQWNPQPA